MIVWPLFGLLVVGRRHGDSGPLTPVRMVNEHWKRKTSKNGSAGGDEKIFSATYPVFGSGRRLAKRVNRDIQLLVARAKRESKSSAQVRVEVVSHLLSQAVASLEHVFVSGDTPSLSGSDNGAWNYAIQGNSYRRLSISDFVNWSKSAEFYQIVAKAYAELDGNSRFEGRIDELLPTIVKPIHLYYFFDKSSLHYMLDRTDGRGRFTDVRLTWNQLAPVLTHSGPIWTTLASRQVKK